LAADQMHLYLLRSTGDSPAKIAHRPDLRLGAAEARSPWSAYVRRLSVKNQNARSFVKKSWRKS
jgi:hypothetical protein